MDGLSGQRVLVAGLGISGRAVVQVLGDRNVEVITYDDRHPDADHRHITSLDTEKVSMVVTSPGLPPAHPVLHWAASRDIPIWSEIELAWRLSREHQAPWLALTGTNGKTTTVGMLTSMLQAAGLRVAEVGNVGTPAVIAATERQVDVFAVELSSFQLHYTNTMAAQGAAILNIADDHLDWHGSREAYTQDKGRIYQGATRAAIYNTADQRTTQLAQQAQLAPSALRVGFAPAAPAAGQLGIVDGALVDQAYSSQQELATIADLQHLAGPDGHVATHVISNALAAAALALAQDIPVKAVALGLQNYSAGAHRISTVATVGKISFVDDSKATNAHAAAASLSMFAPSSVVWIAGGLAKGARFDELVQTHHEVLAGVVLIGVDPEPWRTALSRHAPQVPVIEVSASDTGNVMSHAVQQAHLLAQRYGVASTVLLAPAAASMDQFVSYADRGDQFTAAARLLARR